MLCVQLFEALPEAASSSSARWRAFAEFIPLRGSFPASSRSLSWLAR